MGSLSQTLNRTEQTFVELEDQNSVTKTEVDSLMSDTQKLDETVQELQLQVQFIKNSNIRGKRKRTDNRLFRFPEPLKLHSCFPNRNVNLA